MTTTRACRAESCHPRARSFQCSKRSVRIESSAGKEGEDKVGRGQREKEREREINRERERERKRERVRKRERERE